MTDTERKEVIARQAQAHYDRVERLVKTREFLAARKRPRLKLKKAYEPTRP